MIRRVEFWLLGSLILAALAFGYIVLSDRIGLAIRPAAGPLTIDRPDKAVVSPGEAFTYRGRLQRYRACPVSLTWHWKKAGGDEISWQTGIAINSSPPARRLIERRYSARPPSLLSGKYQFSVTLTYTCGDGVQNIRSNAITMTVR